MSDATIATVRVFYPSSDEGTGFTDDEITAALGANENDLNLTRLQLARTDYARELDGSAQFVAVGDYSENRSENLKAKKQLVDELELLTGQGLAGAGLDDGVTRLVPVGLDRSDSTR